jgi:hypothetical protein
VRPMTWRAKSARPCTKDATHGVVKPTLARASTAPTARGAPLVEEAFTTLEAPRTKELPAPRTTATTTATSSNPAASGAAGASYASVVAAGQHRPRTNVPAEQVRLRVASAAAAAEAVAAAAAAAANPHPLTPGKKRRLEQVAILTGDGSAVHTHAAALASSAQSAEDSRGIEFRAMRLELEQALAANEELQREFDLLKGRYADLERATRAEREEAIAAAAEMRVLLDDRDADSEGDADSERPPKWLCFASLRSDPAVRKRASQLTGFSSAEAMMLMWDLMNHNGAASRIMMWNGEASVTRAARDDRQRQQHARPRRHVGWDWSDIFFYWWFVVKTGVDHTVAALMFGIEYTTATRAFVSMTCFQDEFWVAQFPNPTLEQIQATTPEDYIEVSRTYKLTKIFDCKVGRCKLKPVLKVTKFGA